MHGHATGFCFKLEFSGRNATLFAWDSELAWVRNPSCSSARSKGLPMLPQVASKQGTKQANAEKIREDRGSLSQAKRGFQMPQGSLDYT